MDDAEFMFKQTSAERKRTGRGAMAKKNGSKSKKCGLPSDHLSEAEKKKLNGSVEVYNLGKPMTWEQFRKMSHDLQSEYIRKLAGMGAGRNDIADMFRVKPFTYSNYMTEHHRGEKFISTSKNRNNDEFVAWFLGEEYEPKENDGTASVTAKAEEPKGEKKTGTKGNEKKEALKVADKVTKLKHTNPISLNSGTISYTGKARAIFEKILLLMGEEEDYEITVNFSKTITV